MKLSGILLVLTLINLVGCVPLPLLFNEDNIETHGYESWKMKLNKLQKSAKCLSKQRSYIDADMMDGGVLLKYKQLFEEFVGLFGRNYSDEDEHERRFLTFLKSLERHQFMNERERANNGTAVYGINKFSDWTTQEFKTLILSSTQQTFEEEAAHATPIAARETPITAKQQHKDINDRACTYYLKPYPQKVDWKDKVTRIKNQGSCGSCWAFVGSEQIEMYWAIKTGTLVERSPQELLSCSPSLGCEGGNTCLALQWLEKTRIVLETEKNYPYEEKDTACRQVNKTMEGPRVDAVCGCQNLVNREDAMLRILDQKGPLSVNVDAVQWHDYIGGIIQHHCTNKNMNHAVQLIGYDLVSGPIPYYIARNQWGKSFGEDGYVRIKYGDNQCGIAQQPSFIQVV